MKLRRHSPPPIAARLRRRPEGIDEADWVDMVKNVPVDDELACIYDSGRLGRDRLSMDIQDCIDRRGLDLGQE